jgi:hypothetical protein
MLKNISPARLAGFWAAAAGALYSVTNQKEGRR